MNKNRKQNYKALKGVDTDFEKNCCFCGREVKGIGHNPKPVEMREGAVCCDFCDCNIVLRARISTEWFWEELWNFDDDEDFEE